jgi:methyl-accepting chemotaxis protein
MQNSQHTSSLQLKLVTVVIVVLIVGQAISGFIFFSNTKNKLLSDLKSVSNVVPNRLALNLEESIWNLNKEQSHDILLSEMNTRDIVAIIVYEKDKKSIFSALGRDNSWKAINIAQKPTAGNLIISTKEVKRQADVIGFIEVYVTKSFVNDELQKLFWYNIILMAGLIAVIGGLLSYLLRAIVIQRIRKTSDMLKDIATGDADLTKRIQINVNDEIGELGHWFNEFIDQLEKMVADIKSMAQNVNGATQEVKAGSQGLSQATQEQASAIEEVAATVEEMTSSIKLNAENALDGKQKANDMVNMANKSNEGAQELARGMRDISSSSKKIGDIITTVNEVAFQTNLLALNAAVEAARAGEHGKGFAVVAEEVRALAQRSADASKQIKSLIEDTVNKINAGDALVKKSGESLEEIIMHIHDLSSVMEEIAAASSEQATGVDEVNRAIAQIDSTTQQNASTVEELASTSENLSNEAGGLSQTVSRFKVSQQQRISSTSIPKPMKKHVPEKISNSEPVRVNTKGAARSSEIGDDFEEF